VYKHLNRQCFEGACQLTFNGIHGAIPQTSEVFIITAVKNSNPLYRHVVIFNVLIHN
jgi:hypothetical protein